MARLPNRLPTIRSLFSSSGNQCAFPGCEHELINHKHQFVAQVCHINAASSGGERYDPELSDEALRGFDNLMIMCYTHHIETNDVAEYPPDRLRKIKAQHESNLSVLDFSIPKIALEEALFQENNYWQKISRVNTIDHVFEELRFSVDPEASFYTAVQQLRDSLLALHALLDTFAESDETLPLELKALFDRLKLDSSLLQRIPY